MTASSARDARNPLASLVFLAVNPTA